jgi:hypothetical protein
MIVDDLAYAGRPDLISHGWRAGRRCKQGSEQKMSHGFLPFLFTNFPRQSDRQ